MSCTRKRWLWGRFAVGLLMLWFAGTAVATTIYSNFGAGPTYDGGTGLTVSGSASAAGFFSSAANPFTSSGNYQLSQIDLALSFVSGTNSATVTLNSDSSGLPGAVLATWNLSSLPVFGTCCTVETLTPSSTVFLSAGTQYWIVAAPGASNTWDAWNLNNTGATGLIAFDNGSGFFGVSGRTLSAFDVLGVPEPTTLALISGGLALLLVRRRRAS